MNYTRIILHTLIISQCALYTGLSFSSEPLLTEVIAKNNPDQVTTLLEHRKSQYELDSALIQALGYSYREMDERFNQADIIRSLLDAKADPNTRRPCDALPALIICHEPQIMRMLLDAGADPERKSADGNNALSVTGQCNNYLRKLLLKKQSTLKN